jgi:uncharacterized protein
MRTTFITALIALTTLAAIAQPPQTPQTIGPNYRQEIQKYRAWRVNDDKQNWATLAGLFWLKPGVNTFGTAADNALVFPKGTTAAHAGEFDFENNQVTVKLAKGVAARIDGKPVTTAPMKSDSDGGQKPAVLDIGTLQMRVIQRGQRTGLRLKDLANPALKSFHAPHWYPADPAYHVVATWEPGDGKKKIVVPNILGDATPVTISGTAHFTLNGKPFAIVPVEGDPNKSVEFVFSDETTNKETYPAGRMVDAGPVKDGKIVIDFNEAYNPPCAVTAFATCPIAPKENRLAVPIRAGAKYDKNAPHPGKVFVAP